MHKYFHVDTFTSKALKGNQAGVVLGADNLSDMDMQLITKDLNLSEVAYIQRAKSNTSSFRIRWFSTTKEILLSGHSTIAAIHVLIRENQIELTNGLIHTIQVEYNGGILPISISKLHENDYQVWFGVPIPEFFPYGGRQQELFNLLSLSDNDIDTRLPIFISDSGYIFVPVLGVLTLKKMTPNFSELMLLMAEEAINGICTFSRETMKTSGTFHSRFFAPTWGINEDSVTGTSNAQLGCYWVKNVIRDLENRTYTFNGEQGYVLGRDGEVKVKVTIDNNEISSVEIGGTSKILMQGYLDL